MGNIANIIMTKIMTLPGIIIGLSFHEFAHAWMSNKLGDPTPKRQGRVTINPKAHIDLAGLVFLIFFGFGWGKPVMIDPYYYKNRRRDEFLVAIAGVTMNLIIAVTLSIPARMLASTQTTALGSLSNLTYEILYYAIVVNLCLMIFNLIPVPPLDGWTVINKIFNLDKYKWSHIVYQYGMWILMGLIIFNITDIIIGPAVSMFLRILF